MMTIYSVGDIWYLSKVFDAVAMLSGAEGGLKQASAVAALFGVIIICFQSIVRNQGINIHHMLICYIVYLMCFGFTTSVAIESAYADKQVIQKDNVPYGPAVMGYVVSQMGYKLTRKMEQAFQDIDDSQKMTNPSSGGYLNSLYLIQNLGRIAEDGTIARAVSAVDPDFQPNFLRYTSECTIKGMYFGPYRGGMDWQLLQTKGVWDAIRFDSDWYTTEFREKGQAGVYSCTEAHGKLKSEWDNVVTALQSGQANDEVKNIALRLGQCSSNGNCSNQADFLVKSDTDALRTLFNSQAKAQDFVLAGYADNLIKTGLANGFTFMGNTSSAAMMQQAINQRQIQWAAEQNMFLKSVRPMMSFVEGFFYAIAPFASIILMLGLFGLNIFFKYLLLLVWVQLWLPVMAIANMFIAVKANAFLSNLPLPKDGSSSTVSLYVYETALEGVKEYISTGAVFMATTPLLTFIVLTGSNMAMTSLTGRMSGGDFVNEKLASPDIVSPAAAMSMGSSFTGNPTTGAWRNGISRQIDISEGLNSVKSSLDSQIQSSTRSLENDWSKAYRELYKHGQSNGDSLLSQSASSFMHSEAGADVLSRASRIADSEGLSTGWSKDDYTEFASGAALQFFGNGVSARSGFKGSLGAKAQEGINRLRDKGFSFSKEDKDAFSDAKSSILGKALTSTDSSEKTAALTSSMQVKGSDIKNLSRQYSEVNEATQRFGDGFNVTNTELVGNALRMDRSGTLRLLDDLIAKGNLQDEANNKMIAFGRHGAEGEALSKFEAIAQNNKELAGQMYLQLLNKGGYGGLDGFNGISGKALSNDGIVSSNEVGAGTVAFDGKNWNSTKAGVEAQASQATLPNMSNIHTEKTGEYQTKGINAVGDKEQNYNKQDREEMTNHINNSDLYRPASFSFERPGAVTREAYNLSKKLMESTEGTINEAFDSGDFNGAAIGASQSVSSMYSLNNSATQQTLADVIGGDSVLRTETSLSDGSKQAAKDSLSQKASALEGSLAQNIAANSDLTMDQAREKASHLVNGLRNNLQHGNEQGVIQMVNEVKRLSM